MGVAFLALASLAHLVVTTLPARTVRASWLVVPALVGVVAFIVVPPVLSDDIYRYLLDGRTVVEGFAPYAHAPGSQKVADLVAQLPGRINHPELPTIYPPVAQALFGAAAGLGLVGWRVLLVVALAIAAHLAGQLKSDAGGVQTSAWIFSHPLALTTAAGNGNLDVFGVLVMAVAVGFAARQRWPGVGVALGLGAGLKLFPLGLAWAVGGRGRIRGVGFVFSSAALVLALSYAPVMSLGEKATGSLQTYAESWEYNASIHPLLVSAIDAGMGAMGVEESVSRATEVATYYQGQASDVRWVARHTLAGIVAKTLSLVALALVTLVTWRRGAGFAEASVVLLATLFLFSAVVHPWYLLWLLVPAVVSESRIGLGWCATAVLAFWAPAVVADGGVWHDSSIVRLIEYGAPIVFAVWTCASLTSERQGA